jgi:putative ABC transport system substrate-binding protein
VEVRNLLIEHRHAEGKADRLPELAAELVRLKPDVIVASTSPAAQAAHGATKTIPLVLINVGDPVGLGLAASLARPGGNATGTASYGPELAQKILEVAKDLVPRTKHVAIVWTSGNPLHSRVLKDLEAPAGQLGIQLQALRVTTPDELEPAFRTAAAGRADVVWVFGDGLFFAERTRIAAYALSARLPTLFFLRQHVEAGGLASYGPDAPPDDPPIGAAAGGSGHRVVDRRAFIASVAGGLLAAPLAAEAQRRVDRVYRVGFLWDSPATSPEEIEAFRQGLRELGYVEGQNLTIEYRWAEGRPERMRQLAELAVFGTTTLRTSLLGGVRDHDRQFGTRLPVQPRASDPSRGGIVHLSA